MSERNPKHVRFAKGTDPVPEDQQIPEEPSDSADWMNQEPPQYEDGTTSPFDEGTGDPPEPKSKPEPERKWGAQPGEQEARDG